ncbi:MAG TPA: bifunctional pyr operon transcriptional regulator/uracil phosphoribosyltransferase PyrR [Thermodesulfobacteriota bacterium]|jgi:pyrimidine operon attenuation protein/uracil phosphoribosyltransferase
MAKKVIMDSETIAQTVSRITDEIISTNRDSGELVVVGIRTRGIYLAQRLAEQLKNITGIKPPLGTLDISLYRDDLQIKREWPELKKTDIPFTIDRKTVILVDDVIFTGRTSRAAIEAIMDFGRPSSIQLAVLVDRGHRELPIQADYIGKKIDTNKNEKVRVLLNETDGKDEVLINQE